MTILAFYAGILGVMYFFLSLRVSQLRARTNTLMGQTDNSPLHRAVRAHGNFAEYVPLCLILIGFVAASGASATLIHVLCLALIVGRLVHAWGVSTGARIGQIIGATVTYGIVLIASVLAIRGGAMAIGL